MGKQRDRRSQSAATVPVTLTIAGSDSSAGAGIQADLKTFSALGVYGLTAVTCVVAEIPGKVSRIEQVSARMVRDQIEVLEKNSQIGAIKTGLLCSAEIVSAVAKAIRGIKSLRGRRIPLVIDPVMIASSGDRLLEAAAIDAYTDQLFPLATLITPNLDEAALLIGTEIKDRERTNSLNFPHGLCAASRRTALVAPIRRQSRPVLPAAWYWRKRLGRRRSS